MSPVGINGVEQLGITKLSELEIDVAIRWDSVGAAVVAGAYQFGRDDGTVLHANVPTGATHEWSVNDVPQMTLSATEQDMMSNILKDIGAVGNVFGAAQLDLVAGYTILGADEITIKTTAGNVVLDSATDIVNFGATSNLRQEMRRQGPISVTGVTTIIEDAGAYGALNWVSGSLGSDRFMDIVMSSRSKPPSVIKSYNASGSPSARTYTRSGQILQLEMASGTYLVSSTSWRGIVSNA